jgi:hypothetical protein
MRTGPRNQRMHLPGVLILRLRCQPPSQLMRDS